MPENPVENAAFRQSDLVAQGELLFQRAIRGHAVVHPSRQIADFCELHELEVQGIADGDVAAGVKGFDPIANNQLDQVEIDRAENDPLYKMKLKFNPAAVGEDPLSEMSTEPEAMALITSVPELNFTNSILLPFRPSDLSFSMFAFQGPYTSW